MSYDITTDPGKVRLLINDVNEAAHVFTDEEIGIFLEIETGVKRAAALALETIAANEVMVLKVVELLEIKTDGAKVSDALLKRAALLRKQADDADEAELAALEDVHFDIAEQDYDVFSRRELLNNAALRGLV